MSNVTAHVGETRNGEAMAELREGSTIIAKVYANSDATKIRIVLPELESYGQTLISPENKLVEFTREANAAPRTRPASANVYCCVEGCNKRAAFIIERRA